MKVPLLDLKPQYRALKRDIDAAIEAVSESQHFILGPAVKQLEADVAVYCGTQFGIGVSSGTDALLVALMVLALMALVLLLGIWIPGPLTAMLNDAVRYLDVKP